MTNIDILSNERFANIDIYNNQHNYIYFECFVKLWESFTHSLVYILTIICIEICKGKGYFLFEVHRQKYLNINVEAF